MSSTRIATDTPQENQERISELLSLIRGLFLELDLHLNR